MTSVLTIHAAKNVTMADSDMFCSSPTGTRMAVRQYGSIAMSSVMVLEGVLVVEVDHARVVLWENVF